ncbi:MAG: DUF433 domain-containing protein [Gammaproteobacteria bacterium]|nr:DUF433 domain-containing protein [Gammaproteobacteria bacterium]
MGLDHNRSEISKEALIERCPQILGGTPVFAGTRVPIRVLLEYLESGDRLDDFLNDFPSVSREHAVTVLECAVAELVGNSY